MTESLVTIDLVLWNSNYYRYTSVSHVSEGFQKTLYGSTKSISDIKARRIMTLHSKLMTRQSLRADLSPATRIHRNSQQTLSLAPASSVSKVILKQEEMVALQWP